MGECGAQKAEHEQGSKDSDPEVELA
jgi:hypothetical protein